MEMGKRGNRKKGRKKEGKLKKEKESNISQTLLNARHLQHSHNLNNPTRQVLTPFTDKKTKVHKV